MYPLYRYTRVHYTLHCQQHSSATRHVLSSSSRPLCSSLPHSHVLEHENAGKKDTTSIYTGNKRIKHDRLRKHSARQHTKAGGLSWAIAPQYTEQFRLVLSISKVSAANIQCDCASMPTVRAVRSNKGSRQWFPYR